MAAPPVANDDSYTTAVNTTLTVPAPGVLGNDSSGTTVTNFDDISSNGGTVTVNGNGSFTYIPATDFVGADTFTYIITDDATGLESNNPATVTINVVNPPVAVDDTASMFPNASIDIGVTANDDNPSGNPLTVELVTLPLNGDAVVNGVTVTYTPSTNYSGVDTFTYRIFDGALYSEPATVTVTVSPVAVNDSYIAAKNVPLTIPAPGVLENDVGTNPVVTFNTQPGSGGTVAVEPDGSFTYTPVTDFLGVDEFTYTIVDDDGQASQATVTITVAEPPAAVNDTYRTYQNTTLAVPAPGVLANDGGSPGLEATLASPAANGTATVNSDGSFQYVPAQGFLGTDSFTYQATKTGFAPSSATVTINVLALPIAVNDSYAVAKNTTLEIGVPGLIANDTNTNSNLRAVVVNGSGPSNGSFINNTDGSFSYTPDPNFLGTDTFVYILSDLEANFDSNEATVTINVVEPPVAVDDSRTIAKDTSTNIDVLTNDMNPSGSPLTVTSVTQPSNGTASITNGIIVNYTPDADLTTQDSFTYTVTDTNGLTSTATVNITVNDVPVANTVIISTDEEKEVEFVLDASDADGDVLTYSIFSQPTNGTITAFDPATGIGSYLPNANFNGDDSFQYRATDENEAFASAFVNITVNPVNDPPTANPVTTTTNEDTPVEITLDGTDVEDGDNVTYNIVTLPANGSLSAITGNTVTYTPADNFNGTDTFTYQVNDGAVNSEPATVTINVTAVYDPPVAVDDEYKTSEDTTLDVPAPGVLANDINTEGNLIRANGYGTATNGFVTGRPDGSFSYTPNVNFNGTDTFTYRIIDVITGQFSNTATVTINVSPVSDVPFADDKTVTTAEDTSVTIQLTGRDVEGSSLTYQLTTLPANGSVTLDTATGIAQYTPAPNFNGSDSFGYTTTDSGGLVSRPALVSITVTPVNDPPTALPNTYTVKEDEVLVVPAPGVLGNDTDVEGTRALRAVRTAALVTGPTNGTLILNPDGSFTYTPNPNFNGTDSFTYTASDGDQTSAPATVTIMITAQSEPTPSTFVLTLRAAFPAGSTTAIADQPLTLTATNLPATARGTLTFTSSLGQLCTIVIDGATTPTCTTQAPSCSTGSVNYTVTATFRGTINGIASTATGQLVFGVACTGGDPHIVCLDGSRLDVYEKGFYRLFDNLQESHQSPVIMNAEVIRDRVTHEDLYQQVWIKLPEREYTLNFQTRGIRTTSIGLTTVHGFQVPVQTDHGLATTWSHTYTSPTGERYTFLAEHAQHTIALQTGTSGEVRRYNGLLAGKITNVESIRDAKPHYTAKLPISLYTYPSNALLCGSAQPHVVTAARHSFKLKKGIYRFLQTPSLQCNVRVDEKGLLREAYLFTEDCSPVKWHWAGANHWNLCCRQDGIALPLHSVFEKEIDQILIRVQGNGSLNCALPSLDNVHGLVVGEVMTLNDIEDLSEIVVTTVVNSSDNAASRPTSLYELLIEPILTW